MKRVSIKEAKLLIDRALNTLGWSKKCPTRIQPDFCDNRAAIIVDDIFAITEPETENDPWVVEEIISFAGSQYEPPSEDTNELGSDASIYRAMEILLNKVAAQRVWDAVTDTRVPRIGSSRGRR